jgi:phospholipase C
MNGSSWGTWLFAFAGAAASFFCGCQGVSTPPSNPNPSSKDITQINHIIILIQENRSFDHYFGRLSAFWAANGFPTQPFDGLPLTASNPGCDAAFPPPSVCVGSTSSPQVPVFHLQTMCIENPSPSWDEAHVDFNIGQPTSGVATLNGFVNSAATDARTISPPFHDIDGKRAMGYYDGGDLNYYYFMASNFATSDRWFSPVMTRTQPNRMYLLAGTSHGHVYPLGVTSAPPLPDKTIFQLLQEHGISWKIYVHPGQDGCTATPCLLARSYINMFTFQDDVVNKFTQNLVPVSQYLTDVANGTLPQVALIEPASDVFLDEHPTETSPVNIQAGAAYAASLINALMSSPSWKDSVLIFGHDEFGGLFDHVPPQPAVPPDSVLPTDLQPGDFCTTTTGPTCDFSHTGYRVPLIVISPFTRKNFVSHTVADYTAILKLIETRFKLPSLTARDAAQMDMTEFFDFAHPPWMTPPTPPVQNTTGPCYLDHLP